MIIICLVDNENGSDCRDDREDADEFPERGLVPGLPVTRRGPKFKVRKVPRSCARISPSSSSQQKKYIRLYFLFLSQSLKCLLLFSLLATVPVWPSLEDAWQQQPCTQEQPLLPHQQPSHCRMLKLSGRNSPPKNNFLFINSLSRSRKKIGKPSPLMRRKLVGFIFRISLSFFPLGGETLMLRH